MISSTCFNSCTPTCPGAEALEAAPKVRAEPNVSPVRRLTTPVPAMDMVMIGRSAYFSDISRVADSSVITSLSTGRHYCNLRDISTQLLHHAEASDDLLLLRSLKEIMVGSNYLYTCLMSSIDDCLNNFITCKCFYIN